MDKMQELQEWKNHLRELVPQIQEQIDWIEQGNVQAMVNPSCPEKLKSVAGRLVEIQNTFGEYKRRDISKEDIERIKYYSKQNDIGFSDVVKLAVSNSRYVGASELEARGVAFYILEIQSVFKKYYEDYGVFPINAMNVDVKRACRNFKTDVTLSEKIEAIIDVFMPELAGIKIVDKDLTVIPSKNKPLTQQEIIELAEYFNKMAVDDNIDRCFETENHREFLQKSKVLSRANISLEEFLDKYMGFKYSKCYEARVVPAVAHMLNSHYLKHGTTRNITHTDPYLRHKIEVAQKLTKKYSMVELIEELKVKGDNVVGGRSQLTESEIVARRKILLEKLKAYYPDGCIDEDFIRQRPTEYEELKLIAYRCGFASMDEFLNSNGFHRERFHTTVMESVVYLSESDLEFYNFENIQPELLNDLQLKELQPAEFIGVYNKLISQGLDHSQFENKKKLGE